MFEIRNVSKIYNGDYALKNVSLSITSGMNFIVGASGSGKTTLLKIISGMEKEFDGSVFYCGKDISSISPDEKSYFYNSVYGFVWQDFNLLEDLTVTENILLPAYLKDNASVKEAKKILNDLKLLELSDQKVKYLSGGQKQRVAIARELMKNPQVVIADEPTSALDETTTKEVMRILRTISKSRTVIVVTHDTSLIEPKDSVFELDKGELAECRNTASYKNIPIKKQSNYALSIGNAFSIAKTNITRHVGKFSVSVFSILVAAVLLMTTFSGMITTSGSESLKTLISKYGESILDLTLVNSFTNASGTDGNDESKPNGDVNQDISGLYEKYLNDDRVEFLLSSQYYDNIKVTADGKSYSITNSGSAPVFQKLLAGKMPSNDKNEVLAPSQLIKDMGISNEEAIGKEIEFSGMLSEKQVTIKVTISGVADNTMYAEYGGKIYDFPTDDSFFFSKKAEDDLRNQAGVSSQPAKFTIRAKTPEDLVSLKNELNKSGIVPIGQFELVEDIVKLGTQTSEQSSSASAVIGILSFVLVIAIFAVSAIMKKREYAIYKVSGFADRHLALTVLSETIAEVAASIVLLLVTSPLLNMATKAIFSVEILSINMLLMGIGLSLAVGAIAFLVTCLTAVKTNAASALKAGDR